MAISPSGTRLYVAYYDYAVHRSSVLVLNTAVYMPCGVVRHGELPVGMTVLPDGEYVYVGDDPYLSDQMTIWVWVIRTSDNRVVDSIRAIREPDALTATPDSRFLYVGSDFAPGVLVVRTADNAVVDTLDVPWAANRLVSSRDGQHMYVCTEQLYDIRVGDNQVIDSLGVAFSDAAMIPDGSRLYAIRNQASGCVYVVRLPDLAVEDSVFTNQPLVHIAALAGGRFIYATCRDDSSVYVIRTSDNTVVDRISIGFRPMYIAANPNGRELYVQGDFRCEQIAVVGY